MTFQEGYVYHIKDKYFAKANDDKLMQNKEGGTYRPTFLCMADKVHAGLLWVIPMSSRIEKFQAIHDKQQARYGKCLTIVIGEYDGKQAAFLLQNMFPITEQYLDHIHTRNGNPVPVKYSVAQKVRSNLQQLRQLIARGKRVVFPDIQRLENLMLEELQPTTSRIENHQQDYPSATVSSEERIPATQARDSHRSTSRPSAEPARQSMQERMAAAQAEAERRNSTRATDQPQPGRKHDLEK